MKRTVKNEDIRNEIKEAALFFWQVADSLSMTDGNFSRLLRKELSNEKKDQIRKVIAELKESEWQTMTLPRMRTIKEAAEEIKLTDPQSAIREYFIRDLVVSGQIPHIRAGRKILINLDKLFEYLQEGKKPLQTDIPGIKKIVG